MTDEKHEKIRKLFEDDYSLAEDNRDLAGEDLRFIMVPGGMWEGFLEDHYADKPRMEYDMITQSVDKFMGEWSAGEQMPKFMDEDSEDDGDAKLVDGMFRAAYRKEGGKASVKNAVFEVAGCGFGAVRLGTRYLDEFNAEDTKQEITFTPVFGANSTVVFDSNAKRIDKRDATHVSILWEYTDEYFKSKWPDHETASFSSKDDRRYFDWYARNGRTVYVLEFYEKISRTAKVRVFMNDLGDKVTIEEKDLKFALPELGGYREVARRKVKMEYIEKSLLTGNSYIEEPRRIAGKVLPVIPFYGYWGFIDGRERYFGLVRKQKDPARILNMQLSNLAEQAATSPREAPIFDPEQVKGLQSRWAQAHLGKKNFHLARVLRDSAGNVVQAGPVGYVRPPAVDPATTGLIQFTTDHIRSTSGGMPQDIEDPDASGKAILAVQKRVDMHTYSIVDNIASAVQRMGECYVSMAQEIYLDNRVVNSIGEDGAQSRVQINKYDLVDGKVRKINDISQKRFGVYVDVGPSYDSQRRETIEFLKELLVTLPEGDPRVPVIISSIIDNMQGIGLDTIKEFNRNQMLLGGLVEPKDDKEKQMVAQAQQSQQQPEGIDQLIQSEVAKNMADAQGQEAHNMERMANARKKQAETAKIIESIGADKIKLLLETIQAQNPPLLN